MQQGSAQEDSVVNLAEYRDAKKTSSRTETESDAVRAIEEIAHHLLMAVRAIKAFHQDRH